ncbi:hypothetical protein J2X69_005122 [Algoriphagus sp. 4150]|uniref:DUF6734 family protein n=1 Tax=Algoriphagus sp. 4150 TaxID=2817756 RepID=UPI00285A3016|nr:DUF6734 family protein [Algoriphagus sp. 4150]MDR7132748.1 hypothetical protein [Algoriphagus sp. 4150]
MKIIQSIWTKPFFTGKATIHEGRLNGGWPHRRFNYYSIIFSALQLKRYFGSVELITDDIGKEILVDKLGAPYSVVNVSLNELHEYNSALWALGKIRAYSQQREPFLHVDTDVFLWKRIENRVLEAKLIAQNRETNTGMFSTTFKYVLDNFEFIPPYLSKHKDVAAVPFINAGILGGTEIDFFQYYTSEVTNFIKMNNASFKKCFTLQGFDTTYLNVLLEQIFFNLLAQECDIKVNYLFPQSPDNPTHVGFLTNELINNGYTHSFGNYKKIDIVYYELEKRFKSLYPEEYNRVNQMLIRCEA